MSRREPIMALRHMLDHAREAVALIKGRSMGDLARDRALQLMLTRLLEIIGEAANRVPAESRLRYPGVAWKDAIGLRNRLIHAYDEVDFSVLWQIASEDLSPLIAELEKIVPPAPVQSGPEGKK